MEARRHRENQVERKDIATDARCLGRKEDEAKLRDESRA